MNGDSYLLLVDYFSKFFEVSMLQDTKSLTVIKCLRQNFARYGMPEKLVSDNGPEYSSYEFQAFARDFGFKHITSSPRNPQSNGLAERTVQTAKTLLKKAIEDGQDTYVALLELRNIPLPGVGLSPVQLLMGRRTRSFHHFTHQTTYLGNPSRKSYSLNSRNKSTTTTEMPKKERHCQLETRLESVLISHHQRSGIQDKSSNNARNQYPTYM
jgi:hypothetical protein